MTMFRHSHNGRTSVFAPDINTHTEYEAFQCSCMTFADTMAFLKRKGVGKLDMLFMKVSGYEQQILESAFQEHQKKLKLAPQCLIFNSKHMKRGALNQMTNMMKRHKYIPYNIHKPS